MSFIFVHSALGFLSVWFRPRAGKALLPALGHFHVRSLPPGMQAQRRSFYPSRVPENSYDESVRRCAHFRKTSQNERYKTELSPFVRPDLWAFPRATEVDRPFPQVAVKT